MKLATIDGPEGTRACVVTEDGYAPVGAVGEFPDVAAVYASGADGTRAAERAVGGAPRIRFADAMVRRPVTGPVAVIAVGLNYRTHVLEMGHELPDVPTLFSKLPRSLTDPGADIPMPNGSDQLDYEGEFAVIIGRAGRRIPERLAWDHVGGVTLMNDVSVRDFQRRSTQWFAGKSWQRSTPLGPVVVPANDVEGAELRVAVNGELRQTAVLADLIFDIPRLIADISTMIELQPGDVIATGTPGGVGVSLDPPRFLTAGDVVEVACDAIGTLTNRIGDREQALA